ncbi:hypothetical protein NL676_019894 [Syzygium grande]|nr:hypothetical protein NL676_019894 [Syzygium grande]
MIRSRVYTVLTASPRTVIASVPRSIGSTVAANRAISRKAPPAPTQAPRARTCGGFARAADRRAPFTSVPLLSPSLSLPSPLSFYQGNPITGKE